MSCTRCQGFLVPVPPLFLSSSSPYQPSIVDKLEFDAWQCVNCGEYVDAVILANRGAQFPPVTLMMPPDQPGPLPSVMDSPLLSP